MEDVYNKEQEDTRDRRHIPSLFQCVYSVPFLRAGLGTSPSPSYANRNRIFHLIGDSRPDIKATAYQEEFWPETKAAAYR